jgi:hypothetical protein
MLIHNTVDNYAIMRGPGAQVILHYLGAKLTDNLDKYEEVSTAKGRSRRFIHEAVRSGALKRVEEVDEDVDIIYIAQNPYTRFVTIQQAASKNKGPRFDFAKSKTFKQFLTQAKKVVDNSKKPEDQRELALEGSDLLRLHRQVDLIEQTPTHILKIESLAEDFNWYITEEKGLDSVDLIVPEQFKRDPAILMNKLDSNDIAKLNTIYAEDFENYGYTKL